MYGSTFRVGEARGELRPWPGELPGAGAVASAPEWVVATTHRSAVLRSRQREQDYADFVADLRVAAAALANG
ncbi:hypothetical protein ACT8ZV_18665 [Nocardioides sp. MAHUQ-72]|uniref:hypothetical protein n=1 Tax=unclassified Nocardioides TaxID=2615069 RepID=UPI003610CCE7